MLLRPGSSHHDADGCPHSGVAALEKDYDRQLSSTSSVVINGGNLLESDRNRKDLMCILESVENELHMSSKVSLAEFVKGFIDKEVKKIYNFPEEDNLTQVI